MSALSIQPTYPIFTDIDGQPLEDGFVWIGVAGLDPQVNPIAVYWDAALTIPAAQPIRTLAGYPSNSGTPARLYVDTDYSIRVMNKNGGVLYSAPAATERYNDNVIVTNASNVIYDPTGLGAVARTVQSKLREIVTPADFGIAQPFPLILVNGIQDRYNYTFNTRYNVIAGGNSNVIAGGGNGTSNNEITGGTDYQTISGGYDNTINGCIASTISGGAHHVLSAGVTHGTVGGGSYNDITAGDYGTIAGGTGNTVSASEAAICGGNLNTVAGQAGFIGSGNANSITAGVRNAIVGGASNQITGGNDSVIVGGTSNTITSSFSVVGGNSNTAASYGAVFGFQNTSSGIYNFAVGRQNIASKDYSAAFGYRGIARSTGITSAGGQIGAAGDAQSTDVVGKAVTTSATLVYLNGADNNQFIVPLPTDNVAVTFSVLLTAVEPATGDTKSLKIEGLAKRIGGVNTVVGGTPTITVIAADAGAAAWTTGVNLSTNNLRVACVGEVGKTIRWSGKVTAVEVSF